MKTEIKPKNSLYINLLKEEKIMFSTVIENINVKDLSLDEIAELFSLAKDANDCTKLYKALIKIQEEAKIVDILIKNVNLASAIYEIALRVKNQKLIEKLADAIIKTKDVNYIYQFASYIKGAPIDKLADAVIEKENAKYIYKFAHDIEGAPIDRLADGIIKTRDPEYIYQFALIINGAPIDKLEQALIKMKSVYYIIDFALYVEGASRDKLIDVVLDLKPKSLAIKLIKDEELDINMVERAVKGLKKKGIDVTEIEKIYNIVGNDNLLEEIMKNGLIKSLEKSKQTKKYYLDYLVKKLPKSEFILQVYLDFLTTDMSVEEASVLDLKYKRLMLEKVKEEAEETKDSKKRGERKPE